MRWVAVVCLTGVLAGGALEIGWAEEDSPENALPPELFPDRDAVLPAVPLPSGAEVFPVRQAATFDTDPPLFEIRMKVWEERNGEVRQLTKPVMRTPICHTTSCRLALDDGERALVIELEPQARLSRANGDREAEAKRELKFQRVLQRRIGVDFHEIPLRQAFVELGRRCDINIVIDPAGFEDEGVAEDKKISLSSSGMRLSTILDELLAPLLLDYVVTDDVIKITSLSRARGEPVTVTYPVADLLAPVEEGGVRKAPQTIDDLAERVARRVAPTTWSHKGGWGKIRPFHATQSLVVRQVPDVQDEIAEYLKKLRNKQAAKIEVIPVGNVEEERR